MGVRREWKISVDIPHCFSVQSETSQGTQKACRHTMMSSYLTSFEALPGLQASCHVLSLLLLTEFRIFSSFYCREWIRKEVLNKKSRSYSVRLCGWRVFDRGSCYCVVFLQEKSVVTTESVSKPDLMFLMLFILRSLYYALSNIVFFTLWSLICFLVILPSVLTNLDVLIIWRFEFSLSCQEVEVQKPSWEGENARDAQNTCVKCVMERSVTTYSHKRL